MKRGMRRSSSGLINQSQPSSIPLAPLANSSKVSRTPNLRRNGKGERKRPQSLPIADSGEQVTKRRKVKIPDAISEHVPKRRKVKIVEPEDDESEESNDDYSSDAYDDDSVDDEEECEEVVHNARGNDGNVDMYNLPETEAILEDPNTDFGDDDEDCDDEYTNCQRTVGVGRAIGVAKQIDGRKKKKRKNGSQHVGQASRQNDGHVADGDPEEAGRGGDASRRTKAVRAQEERREELVVRAGEERREGEQVVQAGEVLREEEADGDSDARREREVGRQVEAGLVEELVRDGEGGNVEVSRGVGEHPVNAVEGACASVSSRLASDSVAIIRRLILETASAHNRRADTSDKLVQKGFQDVMKRIEDLQSSIAPLYTLLLNPNGDSVKRSRRQIVLDTRVAVLESILTDEVMREILEFVLCGFLANHFKSKSQMEVVRCGVQCLKGMIFSVLPNEKRLKFKTTEGSIHTSFRKGFMLSILKTLQADGLNLFDSASQEDGRVVGEGWPATESTSTGGSQMTKRIAQPTWLKPGFVRNEHCEIVCARKENAVEKKKRGCDDSTNRDVVGRLPPQTKPPPSPRVKQESGRITRDEIAVHGAMKLYCMITNLIARSRDAIKLSFYEEVGYLFSSWSQHGWKGCQGNMKLWWEHRDTNYAKFEEVEEVSTLDFQERIMMICENDDELACNVRNMQKMKKLVKSHPYLVLFVEHDVCIRGEAETGTGRGRGSAVETREVKRLTRCVNLVDVACRMLSVYSGIGNVELPTNFVSCHVDSLRCAYVLAVVMRELLTVLMPAGEGGRIMWLDNDEVLARHTFHGLAITELFPAKSRMKDTLVYNLLTLTEEEYKMRNIRTGVDVPNGVQQEDARTVAEKLVPIEEDPDKNVFNVERRGRGARH